MKLSAPVYLLKHQAKSLAREERIPLHRALDRIAHREGYAAWSALAASIGAEEPLAALARRLTPGELVLLAARPMQGKTLLSLQLVARFLRAGHHAAFFTLEFTRADVEERLAAMGVDVTKFASRWFVDDSDSIRAETIEQRLSAMPSQTFVVIDYLQLLDQDRRMPSLTEQVWALRRLAHRRQLIVVCLSQIDRRFDAATKDLPGDADVRLPNPLDLGLFDTRCFLNRGSIRVDA